MNHLTSGDTQSAAGDGLSPQGITCLFVLEPMKVNLFRDRGVPGGANRLFAGR